MRVYPNKNFYKYTVLLILLCISNIWAQSGSVSGIVTDAANNSLLWGTNILIAGTSIGTTTNQDGKYNLYNVKEGKAVIIFRYIGYKTDSVKVNIKSQKVLLLNIKLKPEILKGKEVVITAQLQGQQAAINQQINSNSIVNIVSKDKIEALPDQNAAESLARLPGISLVRSGGEGQKVVISGLAPKYSDITINGIKIPSTDQEDRSVDLSSISSDMLAGIEVYKSITADMDGDAVGGSVNFTVKKARKDFHGNFKIQKGYSSQQNYYGNYRGSLDLSDRFLNNKLGIIGTANIQRADRSSDAQDVNYSFASQGATSANIQVDNLNLADVQEIRDRYGASLAADYDLGNGSIFANSFWSKTDQNELRRRKRYQIANGRTQYELRNGNYSTQLLSNGIHANYNLGIFQFYAQAAYSQSYEYTPLEINDIFQELSSLKPNIITTQGPQYIPLGVKDSLNNTTFKESDINSYRLLDISKVAQFDVKVNFDFGSDVAGFLKFGGKYRENRRSRNNNQYWTSYFNIDSLGMEQYKNLNSYYRKFNLSDGRKILMSNFLSPTDQVGKFLNGAYNFGPSLDLNSLNEFLNNMRNVRLYNGTPLFTYNPIIALQNYAAIEDISAFYAMAQISFTPKLLFIPGLRIERTYSDYKSITGTPTPGEDVPNLIGAKDTVGSQTYYDLLPMIQLKYKIEDWMDIRAAVTRTLSRPDYFNLVPWQQIDIQSQTINKGNPILKHTRVWNYNLYFSIYNNYGLFTIGGFYKKLYDVSYIRISRVQGGIYNGYTITQPVNAESPSYVYGIEFDVQSNLALLPSPFDGIVFSANLSLMKSRTYYPLLNVTYKNISVPPYVETIITNTERAGNMPEQANYLGNLSIGYEKGGFSGRLSAMFQGKSLAVIGQSAEFDGYTDSSVRWDLIMQQKVFKQIAIYVDANNLTNIPDKSFLGSERFPTNIEYYGWTADLGIKYKF